MSEPANVSAVGLELDALARPTSVRWRIVALLMMFSFMNHFNRSSMALAGDERIMKLYNISPTRMGWVYSAFLIAYALAMTPGGWFIDRVGPKRALAVMGIGSGIFVLLTGAVGLIGLPLMLIWPTLLVVRSMAGLCSAPLHPASGRMVSYWMPLDSRAMANGLALGAATVGIAFMYPVFSFLIDRLDWPGAFLCSGTVTASLGLFWAAYATDRPYRHRATNEAERKLIKGPLQSGHGVEESGIEAHEIPGASLSRFVWRNRSLILLTVSYSAVGYFEYLFVYWMHYYFEQVLVVGKEASQYYAGIPQLAEAVGMPIGGWLSDRLVRVYGHRVGRSVVPVGGMLASAALLGMGVLAKQPVLIVTWFSLAMLAVGATESPFWMAAIELGGRRGGTTGGIVNTGGNAGGLLAPIVTPWVGLHFGWQWAVSLGSLYCILGAAIWFWINPAERLDEKDS
jgi:MFS transporter, ACS family, D-galactonate transporter